MKIPLKKLIPLGVVILLLLGAVVVFVVKQMPPRAGNTPPLDSLSIVPEGIDLPDTVLVDSVQKQLAEKVKVDPKDLQTTILQNSGAFLHGIYKSGELTGDFYVACKDLDCVVVFAGNTLPPCKVLDDNGFSGGIAPDCINASGEIETRLFAQ